MLLKTPLDGSTARLAIQPKYVPTLLEESGCGVESTANQYCEAIRRYFLPKEHPQSIDYKTLVSVMGARTVLASF